MITTHTTQSSAVTINKMVTKNPKFLLFGSLFAASICLSTAQSLFRNLMSDSDPCVDVCTSTYPSHTYEESSSEECCLRGCRLYSIIDLVGENNANSTLHACFDNCHDAYPEQNDEISACVLGCNSQKPFSDQMGEMGDPSMMGPEAGELSDILYPFLYMHNMYSNMVDSVTHRMSVSWSFFMQDGKGHFVLVKSQPQVIDASDVDDFDDYSAFRGTSSNLETNIGPWDNTATQMLRHSQLKSARSMRDDFGGELNAAETYWGNGPADDSSNSDWLSCIARRTGVPRLVLCIILLLSALAMIWLCLSAAVTAPDHKLAQQKLSIYGDLEYLRSMSNKEVLKRVHPQDFVEARPLPLKIRVEQV